MYWTAYLLREGARNERWPEERLLPMRRIVDHVLWQIVVALLAMAMIAAAVTSWHHRNGLFWSIFILLQTQTQISTAFARPREPRGTGARLDWSKIRPLRSEHWGQR